MVVVLVDHEKLHREIQAWKTEAKKVDDHAAFVSTMGWSGEAARLRGVAEGYRSCASRLKELVEQDCQGR